MQAQALYLLPLAPLLACEPSAHLFHQLWEQHRWRTSFHHHSARTACSDRPCTLSSRWCGLRSGRVCPPVTHYSRVQRLPTRSEM
jgi:hypothetical protein